MQCSVDLRLSSPFVAVGKEKERRRQPWTAFDLHVRERLVVDLVAELADDIDTRLEQVVTRFEARYGAHPVLQLVARRVNP